MANQRRSLKVIVVVLGLFTIAQIFISRKYEITHKIWTRSSFTIFQNIVQPHDYTRAVDEEHISQNKTKIAVTSKSKGHEGHNGFELAAKAHNICSSHSVTTLGKTKSMHGIPSKRIVYCPMEKIGTTFWRRLFYMLTVKNGSKYSQPYDVPIYLALTQYRLYTLSLSSLGSGNLLTKSSFSFLFVRNPYSRLLSAFVDKLLPPNPTYWKILGYPTVIQFRPNYAQQHLIKSKLSAFSTGNDGHDVTFAEFLKYVVSKEKSGVGINEHVISINRGCRPCTYSYNYIGKMETFKDDAMFILRKLQLNKTVDILDKSFSDMSTDDAITDSIESPFSWKEDVVKHISWEKALQRIWLKLQIRGIIESKFTLDLSKENVHNISVNKFIDMARIAHRNSDSIELKIQKELAKKEAFASVRLSDLKEFRDAFKHDFELFGYEHSPSNLFDRGEEPKAPTKFFNYSHLN